jgi:hypothetical protein
MSGHQAVLLGAKAFIDTEGRSTSSTIARAPAISSPGRVGIPVYLVEYVC